MAAIFHSPPPPSLVLWLPFLRSALNKLFSAIMANTIQSGARSLFNLISRVLISPIYLLEATWSSIVTPFLTAKKSHLYKIRHPQKDQRPYLCWNTSQTSTACLMSGKLPGGCVHITHAHVLGCSAVTDGSVWTLITHTRGRLLVFYKNCDLFLISLHDAWKLPLNLFLLLCAQFSWFMVIFFYPILRPI